MTLSRDTSPEAERVQIEIFRRMSAWKKLELVGQLNELVRGLVMAGLRERHPHAIPTEIEEAYFRLTLGPQLAVKVLEARRARAANPPGPRGDGQHAA